MSARSRTDIAGTRSAGGVRSHSPMEGESAMPDEGQQKLDQAFERLEQMTPDRVTRMIRWLRSPASRWVRIPLAILLIAQSFVFFLPDAAGARPQEACLNNRYCCIVRLMSIRGRQAGYSFSHCINEPASGDAQGSRATTIRESSDGHPVLRYGGRRIDPGGHFRRLEADEPACATRVLAFGEDCARSLGQYGGIGLGAGFARARDAEELTADPAPHPARSGRHSERILSADALRRRG